RGKFLQLLSAAFAAGGLALHGKLVELQEARSFQALLETTTRTPWVLYVTPPYGGPERVLQHLARYTSRVPLPHHVLQPQAQHEWGYCPACPQGRVVIVEKLPVDPQAGECFRRTPIEDTS